jgi:hypothetical protein
MPTDQTTCCACGDDLDAVERADPRTGDDPATVTFNMAVSLHDPSWVRLGSLILRLTCFRGV